MRDGKWTRPTRFEFAEENLQSGVKEEDSITDVKNTVLDFRVMKPLSFLLEDDKLFRKQAYMEYTQLVFCKQFGMPKEPHRACPTRMHDSILLSFQEYILNHDLTLPPVHLFGGDTGLLNVSGGAEAVIPSKTTESKIAMRNELKAKNTLLLAIPDEHLLKFHGIKDAKNILLLVHRDKLLPQLMVMMSCFPSLLINLIVHRWTMKCRAPRSQGNRNGDNTRRVVPVETLANDLVVTDGMGYDWSYQAEEGPKYFLLMAFLLDKTGLGYDSQLNESDLNNKSDVFESASDGSVNESEEDNNQANDRYKAGEGYHAVPPPYTGNFMPLRPNLSFASILFTKTECLVISPDFKLPDENQVLLKVPKQNNMYNFDLKNIVPSGGLTCLFAKATIDESNLWHRRLGHINFKTMNKLVRGNLVKGLPSKIFENDHTCVAFQKGKQHKASYLLLPTTFWAEAVSTDCYVKNRVLVTKPHNKTPYELLIGISPNLDFMKPFGCPVTILNTLYHLGKFKGNADDGFLVGYSVNSKAFRVFNFRTKRVEENLHIKFLENKPNVAGGGPEWLFDIDSLTKSMNYKPVPMDVKSAFLYGKIEEEVYVCQPPGFEDLHFPNKVYKVEKALYGLYQAPRAWYETLSTYLLENGFRRGTINKTLFIKNDRGDILLVQVYVDDVIFGSTKKSLCDEFEQMMHKRFQMSSMRELTFFLGLQTTSTLMEPNKALIKDAEAKDVDVYLYISMIRSFMYLTASRPDIMFVVYACARFQVTPKTSHLHVVKRIFRYLKGQPELGLWYPRDSPFDLEAFSNSDYARASLDRKSITGDCQFLGTRLISRQCVMDPKNQMLDYGFNFMNTKIYIDNENGNAKFHQIVDFLTSSTIHYALTVSPTIYSSYIEQFWATAKSKTVNDVKQIHAKVDGKTVVISESSVRSDFHFNNEDVPPVVEGEGSGQPSEPQPPSSTALPEQDLAAVGDEAVYTGEDDRVVRAATIAASLEAEQESSNINKTRPTTTLNKPSPYKTGSVNTSGSGEDIMEHQDDLTDFVPPTPHDLPLSGDHTPKSDKGRPNINELMNLCTQLSKKVFALEQFKTAQDLVIKRLKKKVKRLKKRQRARTLGMKLFKIGTSKKKTLDKENDVNADEPVSTAGDAVNAASVILDVSAAGPSTSTVGDIFEDEMTTMADTLMAIRRTRPRTTSVVIHDVKEEPRRATSPPTVQSQDKEVNDSEQQVESSKKRSRADHDKESVKKQKLEGDNAENRNL
nr:hypothetical protein [Tanacetum cinerariifolium]